jgi:hypothetical protein
MRDAGIFRVPRYRRSPQLALIRRMSAEKTSFIVFFITVPVQGMSASTWHL